MSQATPTAGGFQEASPAAFASGTRAAGLVITLGYLTGVVGGPVVAVVGGLALITYGRSLLLTRVPASIAGAAIAVIAGALGIGALRWEALELAELRGVQAVLGPTLLVGPTQSAVAAGVAGGAALLALAVWLSCPWPSTRPTYVWTAAEAAAGALAVASVFFDPAQLGLDEGGAASMGVQLLRWAGVVAVAGGAASAGAWFLSKKKQVWRVIPVVVAAAAVLAAAALQLSGR